MLCCLSQVPYRINCIQHCFKNPVHNIRNSSLNCELSLLLKTSCTRYLTLLEGGSIISRNEEVYGVTVKPGTAGPTCGPVGAGLLLRLVEGVDLGRPLAGLHVLVAHGAVSPVPSPPQVTCPGVTAATLTLPLPARCRRGGKQGIRRRQR